MFTGMAQTPTSRGARAACPRGATAQRALDGPTHPTAYCGGLGGADARFMRPRRVLYNERHCYQRCRWLSPLR